MDDETLEQEIKRLKNIIKIPMKDIIKRNRIEPWVEKFEDSISVSKPEEIKPFQDHEAEDSASTEHDMQQNKSDHVPHGNSKSFHCRKHNILLKGRQVIAKHMKIHHGLGNITLIGEEVIGELNDDSKESSENTSY